MHSNIYPVIFRWYARRGKSKVIQGYCSGAIFCAAAILFADRVLVYYPLILKHA